jgi:hypothetical protein
MQRTVEIRISRKQRLIELRISRMQRQSWDSDSRKFTGLTQWMTTRKKIGPRYNKMIQIVLAVFDCTRIDGVWSFSGGMNLLLLQWRRWRKLKDYWIKKAQRLLPQESSKISGIFHWWRQYDTSNCKTAWIFFFFWNEEEKAQRLLNQASWKISGFSLHRQQYDKSNCKSA